MSYEALFYPKSIAIVGASRKVKTVGNDIVKNLVTQGFAGNIYPVNPKADNLYGKQVYPDVASIPEEIDLVIVAVPARVVSEVVKEAHDKKGAKAAIVISAGCKEIGNIQLEKELTDACKERGMSLVGPNCLGIINPEVKMNASFAGVMPKEGNVAFVSQSGALCTAVLDHAVHLGIGFSKFMSIGNKADINELKLLKYFAEDEKTKVIAFYVEQLENAPELIDAVRNLVKGPNAKPVIILKSGKTEEGSSAIASHTGSLSGGDIAYESLFAQAGVIRANTINEMFNYVQLFSKNPLQPVENVAIVTNAGGPGVLTTDALIESGLKLSKLTDDTKKQLEELLPTAASTHNPIDVLGDAVGERYQKTLNILVEDETVDAIIVLLTPQSMTEITKTAHAVVHSHYYGNKPVVASFMGRRTVKSGVETMLEAGVACMRFPESAARALGVYAAFEKQSKIENDLSTTEFSDVDYATVESIFEKAKTENITQFPEAEALEILKAYNFPLLQSRAVTNPKEIKNIASEMQSHMQEGQKYALKIISKDILHKSDVGGVMLNITLDEIEEKSQELMARVGAKAPDAALEGVLVMEMAPQNGIELILGVSQAPGLGTMILIGLGGVYVEILKDVQMRYLPLTKHDAQSMMHSLKSSKLFAGVRGSNPADLQSLEEAILRLAKLVTDFPEIVELDINPLLVLEEGNGVKVLDARIVIKE